MVDRPRQGWPQGFARVGVTATTQIASLTSGKANLSALATVALTGKWSDLIGAPTSSGGTATTLASTAFTGVANGAAWPSPWTTGQAPTGGSVTVQSERGQLATGTTTGNYSSADGASARYTTQIADFNVLFTFRRVGDVHVRFVARCNTGTAYDISPGDGLNYGLNPDYPNHRALAGPGFYLAYTLHKDAVGGEAWGPGADRISGVGNGDWQFMPYSVVFLGANKANNGFYSDDIQVTLTY